MGVSALLGYGGSSIRVGDAYSGSSGLLVGVDGSVAIMPFGESILIESKESKCSCEVE